MRPTDFNFTDPNWKLHKAKLPPIKLQEPRELGYGGRDYQVRRYKAFNNKTLTLTVAPTGSGKSLMQIFDSAREIIQTDYQRKQIFIVPQLNIGYGFTERKHPKLLIDGKVYNWEVTENCCEDNDESVARVKKFLLKKPHPCKSYRKQDVLGGVTCVVSYAAFLAAFQSMTLSEKKKAIINTSFRVDEIQHVAGVSSEEDDAMNRLGSFCKFVLDHDGFLHLMTATFFRSNHQSIIHHDYLDSFDIFRVPFLEHWDVLNLRELQQNFVCYKSGKDLMNKVIKSIKQETEEPSLVIVPADGTGIFKNTNKPKWTQELIHKLENIYHVDEILDLISPERQGKDKKRLMSENQNFKVVVTCMIGREGSDWPPCSRIHNLSLDHSTLPIIQKLGRGLREHPDKEDVKMFNYIKHFSDWDEAPENIRQKLSDRFNAVVVSSMLDDMFYPILMPVLPLDKDDSEPVKYISLEDLYGTKKNDVIEEMMRMVLSIPKTARTPEAIDEVLEDIIEAFGEDVLEHVDHDVLKDRLRKELLRRQNPTNPELRLDGMIIDFVREHGWDKVVRKNIAAQSPFVGRANTDDLKELQKFLKSDWDAKVDEALKIGLMNLDKDSRLYRFMRNQARLFKRQKDA
jgi:hypothetical protein